MRDYLIFRLYGPMSAWGKMAVGGSRHSDPYPSKSAILGLIAAALGITRQEEAKLQQLQANVGLGVGIHHEGHLMVDYHTSQVPSRVNLKNQPHQTRRDELLIPQFKLGTILSTREYFCDALYTIILWQRKTGQPTSLIEIKEALLHPIFLPYLGRKSCPLAIPIYPILVNASDIEQALILAEPALIEKDSANGLDFFEKPKCYRLYWDTDDSPENKVSMQITRKDQLVNRARWQYSDRLENYKMIAQEGAY
jgi:CRISPR system Cascade subunit CasD